MCGCVCVCVCVGGGGGGGGGGFSQMGVNILIQMYMASCCPITYHSPGALAEGTAVYPLRGHSGVLEDSGELPLLLLMAVCRNNYDDIHCCMAVFPPPCNYVFCITQSKLGGGGGGGGGGGDLFRSIMFMFMLTGNTTILQCV